MGRVRRRARMQERTLSADYLVRLSEAYARFFSGYQDAPLLVVDTREFNPIARPADFAALLDAVCEPVRGRRYFNPTALAIN